MSTAVATRRQTYSYDIFERTERTLLFFCKKNKMCPVRHRRHLQPSTCGYSCSRSIAPASSTLSTPHHTISHARATFYPADTKHTVSTYTSVLLLLITLRAWDVGELITHDTVCPPKCNPSARFGCANGILCSESDHLMILRQLHGIYCMVHMVHWCLEAIPRPAKPKPPNDQMIPQDATK